MGGMAELGVCASHWGCSDSLFYAGMAAVARLVARDARWAPGGVGFSRPWGAKPSEWADPKTKVPRQHMPTWGDFDFDTYLREDLPCAAGYIAAVTGSKRIAAVGHSMGGMLVACMAAGAADYFREDAPKVEDGATSGPRVPRSDWRIDKVVTIASCLECSPREGVPESTYAQFAALAGVVPEYLYGGVA